MTILFITLPISHIILPLVSLDLEILRRAPVVLCPDQLSACIENHGTRMYHRVAAWREKSISRIAFCTGGRDLNDTRLLVKGDEFSRGSESMQAQVVRTQPKTESETTKLWQDKQPEEGQGSDRG